MTIAFDNNQVNTYLSTQLSKFICGNELGEIRNLMKYIDISHLLESLNDTTLLSFFQLIDMECNVSYRTNKNKLIRKIKNVVLPKIKNEHYFEIKHDDFISPKNGVETTHPEYEMTISCYPPISTNNNDNEYIFCIYIILSGSYYCSGFVNLDINKIEINKIDFKMNITEDEKKKAITAFAKNGLKYINSKLSYIIRYDTDEIHNECYLKLDENDEYVDSEEDDCSSDEDNNTN